MKCLEPSEITYYDDNIKDEVNIKVPCGKCILCRERRVKDWTIKLIKEQKYYKKSCFITLTFDNKQIANPNSEMWKYVKIGQEPLPSTYLWDIDNSKIYVQKFIKRLRKKIQPTKIKYFIVGEYGEKNKRPHYHMIIFGYNFEEDRKIVEMSQCGKKQYASDILDDCWKAGRARISELNNRTIGYVAGYSLKKMNIDFNKETYIKNYVPKIKTRTKDKQEYIKWEYKYKPKIAFSNRAKFNSKYINKHPEILKKMYIEDDEKHKYAIPKSYINTIKKSDNKKHQYYLSSYMEEIDNYVLELDEHEEKIKNIIKSKIIEKRIKDKIRADF